MSLFKQFKDRFEFDCDTDVMVIGLLWDRNTGYVGISIGPLMVSFCYAKEV